MSNLRIVFNNPWLLLVLIVGLALAFIPHFRIAKRYRRNRTRITSLVLHIIVMVLAVLLFAGAHFEYNEKNHQNEVILLVDASDSVEDNYKDEKEDAIETIVNYGKYDGFSIGIVKFGFDQEYAVPLTTEVKTILPKYYASKDPDTRATDIAAALNYTKELFTYPETAKIVLITDGIETDEDSLKVIRSISASGIKVDTLNLNTYEIVSNDTMLLGLEMPDGHISRNENCTVKYEIKSPKNQDITIKIFDNNDLIYHDSVSIAKGITTHSADVIFKEDGFHDVSVKVELNDDILENNEFHTQLNIETFNKILIIQRDSSETNSFNDLLERNDDFECDIVDLSTSTEDFTTDYLREYDQVILQNVHHDDMSSQLEESLYDYVSIYGGGLFTLGGDDASGKPNAYKREGSYGTLYQEMLPVQLIDYTPPVGVIFIIDISGSMRTDAGDGSGQTLIEYAVQGAQASLQGLTERDYVGIMSLDDDYGLILPLTPRTQKSKIVSAINSVLDMPSGGTVFEDAYKRAVEQLLANKKIEKRHIIFITDGLPSKTINPSTGNPYYEDFVEQYYNSDKISTSVVLLGSTATSAKPDMDKVATKGHGQVYVCTNDFYGLGLQLLDDLAAPEISEKKDEEFNPMVSDLFSNIIQGLPLGTMESLSFTLGGFYGVKAKDAANVVIKGNYDVPIYAQWPLGKGMVGSFMCDVNGKWSSELYSSSDAETLIKNIVRNLMPNESIRSSGIELKLKSDNYINQLSVYANVEEGETIRGSISCETDGTDTVVDISELLEGLDVRTNAYYVTLALNELNDYTRCNFVANTTGIYKITVEKLDATGTVVATESIYHTFSYSKEYDTEQMDRELASANLATIAKRGNGTLIANNEDPYEVYEGFITKLEKSYDPRIPFLIIIIVLFLLDIAIRKFKFKWPHEIVAAIKNKKKNK